MASSTTRLPITWEETAFAILRILPLITSTAFLTAVYHQSVVFSTIRATTPHSQHSAPLTFKTIRAFGHALIFFTSFFVIGDLIVSLLNIFWHPVATAKYLYLLSFVMKVLHFFPHTPATRLRNMIRDVDNTGEKAAEELFQAMDDWVKLAGRRWFTLDLPTLAVTLAAVIVWSRT